MTANEGDSRVAVVHGCFQKEALILSAMSVSLGGHKNEAAH